MVDLIVPDLVFKSIESSLIEFNNAGVALFVKNQSISLRFFSKCLS